MPLNQVLFKPKRAVHVHLQNKLSVNDICWYAGTHIIRYDIISHVFRQSHGGSIIILFLVHVRYNGFKHTQTPGPDNLIYSVLMNLESNNVLYIQ